MCAENAEEAPPAEETDAQPVKRAAEEEDEEEEVGCLQAAEVHVFNRLALLTNLVMSGCLCLCSFFFFLPSGKSGDKKAEDRGKWRFERGRRGGLSLFPANMFAALSHQPGQHCVLELVLSVSFERDFFFFFGCSHVISLHWSLETWWPCIPFLIFFF